MSMDIFFMPSTAKENCTHIYQDSLANCIYQNIPLSKVKSAAINSTITSDKLDFNSWINSYQPWEKVDKDRFLKLLKRSK